MREYKRRRTPLSGVIAGLWRDPVGSKVIATGIISLLGSMTTLIWSHFQLMNVQKNILVVLLSVTVLSVIFVLGLFVYNWFALARVMIHPGSDSVLPHKHTDILPDNQILERFGFRPGDTPLLNAFQRISINANLSLSVDVDGYYGRVMQCSDNEQADIKCVIKPEGQQALSLCYIYSLPKNILFFVRLNLQSENNDAIKEVEILVPPEDPLYPSPALGPVNIVHSALHAPEKGDWASISINLPEMVHDLFGHQGWHYFNIVGLRLKGSGKIACITLSK
jgi:hypothetical protein